MRLLVNLMKGLAAVTTPSSERKFTPRFIFVTFGVTCHWDHSDR